MMLITAFLFQAVIGLHWAWLFDLQEDFIFKQLSGLSLATFIAYQWRLNRARSRRMTRKAARLLGLHRIVGTLAPIFLYVHTQHWGHGYLNILTGCFLVVTVSGLVHGRIIAMKNPRFTRAWLLIHIGTAALLLPLLGYHIHIGYIYE